MSLLFTDLGNTTCSQVKDDTAAYLSKQCAALTSHRSLMMEAPQVWRP